MFILVREIKKKKVFTITMSPICVHSSTHICGFKFNICTHHTYSERTTNNKITIIPKNNYF